MRRVWSRMMGTLPIELMGVLLYAQLADLITFLIAASVLPISGESNGIVAWIYQVSGPIGVVIWKSLGIMGIFIMATHHRWGFILGWLGIIVATIGFLVNVTALAVMV